MTLARIEAAVAALPRAFPGPGGACAVLRDGQVVVRHAWGYANAERRITFTSRSLFRICSITKQFTCAALLDAFPDHSVLDGDVASRLPLLDQAPPRAIHLAHNQSGLRDYWAVAMLHGAPVESPFGETESGRVIGGTRTLHFAPGMRASYVNQNFRLLSDILEARTGRGFAELLRDRVLHPAGMGSALLAADTRALPDGTEGYEGTQETGFRAAENRILWTGDAGLAASLDDMIAWEKQIDATRDDPGALYSRLSAPVRFADGAPARYGFGLGRGTVMGRAMTAHGGALRGWRSHRLHVAAARLSVVVFFNHLADAGAAAERLLMAALGEGAAPPAKAPPPAPPWLGAWQDEETGLSARIDLARPGVARLLYGQRAEPVALNADGSAGGEGTRLVPAGDTLRLLRPQDNQSSTLRRVSGEPRRNVAGRYRCAELDAELTVVDAGGALYGGFSGFLGQGRMELLDPIAGDLWALPCPRALDHTPPGDWTLSFRRDASGRAHGVEVGCWLARGLPYDRIG